MDPRSCLRGLTLSKQRSNGTNSTFLELAGVQSSSGSHHMGLWSRYAQTMRLTILYARIRTSEKIRLPNDHLVSIQRVSAARRDPREAEGPGRQCGRGPCARGCANTSGYRGPGTASPNQVRRAPAWGTSKQHEDRRDDGSIR